LNSINIGLFGFGRTGSIVAKEIVSDPALKLKWVCRRNIQDNFAFASHALGFDESFAPFVRFNDINESFLKSSPVDIVIDFSSSSAAAAYKALSESKIKIVSAISRYADSDLELVKAAAGKTSVLYSPNITLGINWVIIASKILSSIIPHADIEVVEEHFRDKKEKSGTALRIAQHLQLDPEQHVNSIRVGGIVGKHEVVFGLPNQTVRLVHESINRAAFGAGAIFAAKWLSDKASGFYSMEQVFHDKFVRKIKEIEF
jgi:4-hydroxy-tetrahydrodipicolinate reductase